MSEEIAKALAKAKWNESVRVESDGDDDGNNNSMILVPRLDRENGGVKWEQSTTTDEGRIHLGTKKWIFPMLNDARRNDLYETAIKHASQEAVRRFLAFNSPWEPYSSYAWLRALDIGSGTGLLALLSRKYLVQALVEQTIVPRQPSVQVTSLEMAGPMADLAKRTVELDTAAATNGSVSVIEGHSCMVDPLNKRRKKSNGLWFCTSELLESGLLGEGWLPAIRDAKARHLHPEAVVVPQRARIMAQLVEGAAGFCGPHATLEPKRNPEEDARPALRLFTTAPSSSSIGMLSDGSYDRTTGDKHGIQVEIHADRYFEGNYHHEPVLTILSEPTVALSLDVTTTNPSSKPSDTTLAATKSGRAEGILFWWELDLYGEELTYSTKPGSDFQDHWHQCLYVFPYHNSGCGIEVKKGSEYILNTTHTDSRVHFSVSNSTENESDSQQHSASGDINPRRPKLARPTIPPQVPPLAGPRRCWQLNDVARSATLRDGIHHALRLLPAPSTVLDVSDFSLCGIMASMLGATMVTSIESSSSSGLSMGAARVAQIGNGLPYNAKTNNFQIVQCHAEALTKAVVRGEDSSNDTSNENEAVVDLVVGEPYYEMLEGWPIETALNYFYTIRMLKRKGIVKPNADCVPARAVVVACGIECFDLGNAYNKLLRGSNGDGDNSEPKPNVCGFDHTPVVECWNYDKRGISIPLWEYNNVVPVTEIVEAGTLDYETNGIHRGNWEPHGDSFVLKAPYTKSNRTCHAVAFWVDYKIRTTTSEPAPPNCEDLSFATLSTGFGTCKASPVVPPSSMIAERQTVRILEVAQSTTTGESLAIHSDGLDKSLWLEETKSSSGLSADDSSA